MTLHQCPGCKWPTLLSTTHCAICGKRLHNILDNASDGHLFGSFPQQRGNFLDRSKVHCIWLGLLFAGWILFPRTLFSIQLFITSVYFAFVAGWSFYTGQRFINLDRQRKLTIEFYLFGILAGVSFLYGVGLTAGSSIKPQRSVTAAPPVVQNNQPAAIPIRPKEEDPEQIRIRQQGLRTLSYWKSINQILSPLGRSGQSLDEKIAEIERAIDQLEALLAIGIDPDIVVFKHDLIDFLRLRRSYSYLAKDPAFYLEAILKGAAGDPYSTALEINEADRALKAAAERIASQQSRLRGVLSARYNVQF